MNGKHQDTMKAMVARRYGPPSVLRLEDVPKPVPRAGQVRIEMRAASVNAADWRVLRADPWFVRLSGFGLFRPKGLILGVDGAGRIDAVGDGVTRFRPGDEVYADFFQTGLGGFAEYALAKESTTARKPSNATFVEAAAVPLAGVTALQGLRDQGGIQAGQHVLIHGASGGVGSFAVQLAKIFGARVTAAASAGSTDYLRSLGADRVMDYAREDFARETERYDLILAVGGNRSLFDYRRALKPAGTFVLVGGAIAQLYRFALIAPWLGRIGHKKLRYYVAEPRGADLDFLRDLIEAGKLRVPIAGSYPLGETPAAIRHVEDGHPRGKVVITIRADQPSGGRTAG